MTPEEARELEEQLAEMNAETEARWAAARARRLSPKETWIVVLTDPVAVDWARENVPDDATEQQIAEFAFNATVLFSLCDCGLPAHVITGPELAEWDLALPPFDELPDNRTLVSIAICPDYPNGCNWIEGTERLNV